MKAILLATALAIGSLGAAHAADETDGDDIAALTQAIVGKAHTCIALQANESTANVICELGAKPKTHYFDYQVPIAWVEKHFRPSAGPMVKWRSDGYDTNEAQLAARL